jgi:hypothetical protein
LTGLRGAGQDRMSYKEFVKQGNYPDEYNKTSFRGFEQSIYAWNVEKQRENGITRLSFKDTCNKKKTELHIKRMQVV